MNVMPADTNQKRPNSKYDRLIAAAKAVPAVSTVVVHPCDESSLRGAVEAARSRHHQANPCRSGGEDQGHGGQARPQHQRLRNRRRPAQRSRGRQGRRADPCGQGRNADERQPAHRRADAQRHRKGNGAAHRASHQPCLRHGRAGLCRHGVRHRCRHQHLPRSRRASATSSRTPSISSRRPASAHRRGSPSCRRSRP